MAVPCHWPGGNAGLPSPYWGTGEMQGKLHSLHTCLYKIPEAFCLASVLSAPDSCQLRFHWAGIELRWSARKHSIPSAPSITGPPAPSDLSPGHCFFVVPATRIYFPHDISFGILTDGESIHRAPSISTMEHWGSSSPSDPTFALCALRDFHEYHFLHHPHLAIVVFPQPMISNKNILFLYCTLPVYAPPACLHTNNRTTLRRHFST